MDVVDVIAVVVVEVMNVIVDVIVNAVMMGTIYVQNVGGL